MFKRVIISKESSNQNRPEEEKGLINTRNDSNVVLLFGLVSQKEPTLQVRKKQISF
jgi:hypothetical protein